MGFVPNIGVNWDKRMIEDRPSMKLDPKPLKGLKGRAQTLQSQSLGNYGVKLFNAMPWAIRAYSG